MLVRGAAALSVVLAAATASAQRARPTIAIETDACVGVDGAEVSRIAAIELRASLLSDVLQASVRVSTRCDAGAVVLHVDDSITRKSVERAVRLDAVAPRARARLLALSIAELVEASWAELADPAPRAAQIVTIEAPAMLVTAARESVVQRLAVVRVDPVPRAPRVATRGVWGSIALGARALATSESVVAMFAANAAVTVRWNALFWTQLALEGAHATRSLPDANLSLWVLEARASAHVAMARQWLGLSLGGGFAAGPALIAASATDPLRATTRDTVASWGGPFVTSQVSAQARAWARVTLEVECGVVALSTRIRATRVLADDTRVTETLFALDGFWASAKLGVALGVF